MALYFLTSNKRKFEEARTIIDGSFEMQQLDIDLPEIQEIDPKKIIAAKIGEAMKHKVGSIIVEDTSLVIEGMNGLPGPFIKWFRRGIGIEGIHRLSELFGEKAEARAVIGYAEDGRMIFFEGYIKGRIVKPRGNNNMGWDPIFVPYGNTKTFAEMTFEEKTAISHRTMAFLKLKEFLKKQIR